MYKRNTKEESKDLKKNQEILQIKEATSLGKKKRVRYKEGALIYSMGLHTFMELAKEAKAVYHVKRIRNPRWKKCCLIYLENGKR